MASIARVVRRTLLSIAGVAVLALAGLWLRSEQLLRRRYEVHASGVTIPTDSASLARGAHLARIAACTTCHGPDFAGKVYADEGPIGHIAGPNLTRGRGSVTSAFTAADWDRAIRHGVRRDGTSMIVMPTETYVHFTDADLAAVAGFLQSVPPVDREMPPSRFGPLGRLLLAAGKLDILVAHKTPLSVERPIVAPGPTAAYGRYLADVAGCHGCHGYGLSGGRVAGPPDLPPASNITPAGLRGWTEADFARAVQRGVRPDGRTLDTFMPWEQFAAMTSDDVRALWLYVGSVPPRETGNK